MEFGKVENVDAVNWDLPFEDPLVASFLQKLKGDLGSTCQFYVGTTGWGAKEWVGTLYPPKTSPADYLYHYARNFNCIELNTTHYGIPKLETVSKWISQVTPGFRFCPKIPQSLSHAPNGLSDVKTLAEWVKCLRAFEDFLGPCFLQLPPHFSYNDKAALFRFLQLWPKEFELTIELRHSSWFKDGVIHPPLVSYLQQQNIGLVITDVAGRRDVLHTSISAPYSLLRFVGNDLHASDTSRTYAWCERIAHWQQLGLKQFYFMAHEPSPESVPAISDIVVQSLNEVCGAGLTPMARSLF